MSLQSVDSLITDECDHAEYEEKVKLYKATTPSGLGKVHQIVNDYVTTGVLEEVCAENAVCTNNNARDQQTMDSLLCKTRRRSFDSYVRKL